MSLVLLFSSSSVCTPVCLSVSDEPMGVLLVLVGACDWYSSEQWPPLAGQEEGPAWQNRLAIGWHWETLTPAHLQLVLRTRHSGPVWEEKHR